MVRQKHVERWAWGVGRNSEEKDHGLVTSVNQGSRKIRARKDSFVASCPAYPISSQTLVAMKTGAVIKKVMRSIRRDFCSSLRCHRCSE